jgi:hypothetical protein
MRDAGRGAPRDVTTPARSGVLNSGARWHAHRRAQHRRESLGHEPAAGCHQLRCPRWRSGYRCIHRRAHRLTGPFDGDHLTVGVRRGQPNAALNSPEYAAGRGRVQRRACWRAPPGTTLGTCPTTGRTTTRQLPARIPVGPSCGPYRARAPLDLEHEGRSGRLRRPAPPVSGRSRRRSSF